MKCKYCQAELEPNSSVCPACGKDNLKDNLKGLKITALVLVCVVMLVLLAGLVCYGVTGSFTPWVSDDNDDSTGETTDTTLSAEDQAFYDAMDDVVATMGEHELTNSEMQLYYWMVAYNEENVDLTKALDEQIYDEETGKTYHEYCMEEAVSAWQELMLMYDAAKEAGYEMPESYVESLESMESQLEYYVYMYAYYYGYDISTVDELIQMQFGPGCTYEDYYNYTSVYYYGTLYWTELIESMDATEDEINNYFAENEESLKNDYSLSITKDFGNLIDIRNIMIGVVTNEETDADGNTVTTEDWDATLKKAQDILNEWKSGDMTEESFIALVEEYSEDEGSNANEGLYTDMYKGSMAEVDVRHILIMPEDDTDEEWAAALTTAEDILDQWLAGDKTEESFGELANEYSDDNDGNVTNGGIYTDIYMGQMVEAFEEWCFDVSRQTGDYGIVKTEYGYHIMYYVRGDKEIDDWVNAEERAAGDVELLKCDDGYQIIFYVGAEPAWYRYSRYGVQALKAEDILNGLVEANPFTADYDAVVIGDIY